MKIILIILSLLISTELLAAKKTKKKTPPPTPANLTEKANNEINAPVKLKVTEPNDSENSGVISVNAQTPEDSSLFKTLTMGISANNMQTLGVLKNKKGTELDLSQNSQPYFAQLDFYKTLDSNKYLSGLAFHMGYQQFRSEYLPSEEVLISQSLFSLSTSTLLAKGNQSEWSFIVDLGILNLQAVSSDNSFLNVNDKTYFVGAGMEYGYQIFSHLKVNASASYKSKILSQSDLQIKPLTGSLGVTYVW